MVLAPKMYPDLAVKRDGAHRTPRGSGMPGALIDLT
jgi:hypothetical protein